jgi:hypothetical protein
MAYWGLDNSVLFGKCDLLSSDRGKRAAEEIWGKLCRVLPKRAAMDSSLKTLAARKRRPNEIRTDYLGESNN